MKFENINQLAAYASECHGTEFATLESLASLLADIVSAPVARVQFLKHNGGEIPLGRSIPNVLTGDSGSYIRVTRENGLADEVRFPIEEEGVDNILTYLGRRRTADEERLAEFETALRETLDAYGHLTWTVGNEDWLACADASVGRFDGDLYLAWHVVVDCESGGFTDTLESGFLKIEPGCKAPFGVLAHFLDICFEHYAHEQVDPEGDQPEDPDDDKSHLQIDTEQGAQASEAFDEHLRELLATGPEDGVDLDWSEQEEPFDPVAWGWVGSNGHP